MRSIGSVTTGQMIQTGFYPFILNKNKREGIFGVSRAKTRTAERREPTKDVRRKTSLGYTENGRRGLRQVRGPFRQE